MAGVGAKAAEQSIYRAAVSEKCDWLPLIVATHGALQSRGPLDLFGGLHEFESRLDRGRTPRHPDNCPYDLGPCLSVRRHASACADGGGSRKEDHGSAARTARLG